MTVGIEQTPLGQAAAAIERPPVAVAGAAVPEIAERRRRRTTAFPTIVFTAMAVVCAGLLAFAMFWPRLVDVWRHGTFYDSDDAMRLVQVRALLDGQPWFDMTAYRLDPPLGTPMHWSRTVDLPIAALIRTFELFTSQARSETLTRLVFPFALILGLFAGMARLAATLLGRAAQVPALVATLFCGCAIVQFQPGRIDHHAPQITTLVFMVGAAVAALDPAMAGHAMLAGLLVGLSLSISLENLPFVVCLAGMLVAIWIAHGAVMARMLHCFALGLAGGLIFFYAATVAPSRWFVPVSDAFGPGHLGAGLIGAVNCMILAYASVRLRTPLQRLAAAGFAAGLIVLFLAMVAPEGLHDPFAQVDPLVRRIWMANVTESFSLIRFLHDNRTSALLSGLPVVLGLCGSLVAAMRLRDTTRDRFLLLSVLTATGLAMTFWQIRVFTSVTPLAVCGALPLAISVHDRFRRERRGLMALMSLCLVFPFTSLAFALVIPDTPQTPQVEHAGDANICLAPGAFAPLAQLAPGSVVAPIDSGSFLLAFTGLDPFAAPYHRDNDGNRFALTTFLAKSDDAIAALRVRHATYVMICPGLGETERLGKEAPDGLAAALLAGRVPDGLTPLPLADTPYRVFQIR